MNDRTIIIKVNARVKKSDLSDLYREFGRQLDKGLILVPCFCDVIVVPKDADVKFEPQEDGFYAEN